MEISDFAYARMSRFGITKDQVDFVLQHSDESYNVKNAVVYKAQLPDGKTVKVRVKNGNIVGDVISFPASG